MGRDQEEGVQGGGRPRRKEQELGETEQKTLTEIVKGARRGQQMETREITEKKVTGMNT